MDEISRKFRSIDWKSLQKSARKVQASTASALKDMVMTDLENKTRSATADTSWGASVTDLHQIARGTYNPQDYVLIMSIVWQRLGSSRWRCVYKGLEVLKGAVGHLEVLREYRKISEGRDVGEGVRNRAALVCDMLNDDELLEAEKEKSREIRAKIESSGGGGSISSDQYRYGGMGSTAGTNVSTSATATFKGYDDDAYDEQPAGAFSKLRIEEKKEVDLLGDDDESAPAASKAYDDDDDDAFDPRGTGTSTASQLKEEDDLLALALSGPGVAALPGPPVTNGGLKTSELVQQLAAQRSLALVPAQHSTNNTEDAPHAEDSHSPLTTGAPFQAFDGFGEGSTQSDVKRPAPVPVKLQRKEDADPFGDLLDTAKKSGVV